MHASSSSASSMPLGTLITADTGSYDPTLALLFTTSSGPSRTSLKHDKASAVDSHKIKSVPDQTSAPKTKPSRSHADIDNNAETNSRIDDEDLEPQSRPRKRRKVNSDDLESSYFTRLAREEEQEAKAENAESGKDYYTDESSSLHSDLDDLSDSEFSVDQNGNDKLPIQHEVLAERPQLDRVEIESRTVFLNNVSTAAIKLKSAKKSLLAHLKTVLDTQLGEKIVSIRFRSTAFASDAGPKKATYAKKELMEETTKSTNAYVVLSTTAAARKLALRLNGSIVLDRHLRVDYLGNPAPIDHKRCVFVGNLSFVDQEPAGGENNDSKETRQRGKYPADVEEGLWRSFGKAGKVVSVRVVRDKETRVSKGFAYVQFEDQNGVEAALLMDGKKYPPMLPRKLRVMRAKKIQSKRGESGRLVKSSKHTHQSAKGSKAYHRKSSDPIVFEGHRASSTSSSKGLKNKKRPAVKPNNRSSRRGMAFKAGGGKKKRDTKQ